MTMEAVAEKAGISIGVLFYHFPAKELLIEGMMKQLFDEYDHDFNLEYENDNESGGRTRSYIKTTFLKHDQEENELVMALLAALVNNPDLLNPVKEYYEIWQQQLVTDQINPVMSTILRLTTDGLWFSEIFGLAPIDKSLREQVYDTLMILSKKEKRKEITNNKLKQDLTSTLVSQNEHMNEILKMLKKISSFDTTVILYGESGTGKGLLARYIHQYSLRTKGPFIVINCAALPESLLESELFGYIDGAFTGANKTGKKGLIEAANNGTLFLDEIGELSLNIQAKLLQVLQDREFTPIGETKSRKVNIRIIAATNRNLWEMVKTNQFREDLYYRLNVIDIKVPPLRERKDDIVPLTNYFLRKFNDKYNVERHFSNDVYPYLYEYAWPGNVRELENLIEKLVVISDDIINIDHIPDSLYGHHYHDAPKSFFTSFDKSLEEFEGKLVMDAYHRFKNYRKVAEFLKISQSKAARLIRKYSGSS
ncbi:sigma 54-interacting transcriptional regulator [Peribacillus simplex]|uniref:sigma 54-interacting transcriptional regulator n=1 Tax=Peribacillus simplex TaxID=1478 RepID=UPI00366BB7DC